MNVVFLKIATGEEVVAEEIKTDCDDFVVIRNSLMLIPQQDRETGKILYGFVPWGPMAEGDKKIPLSAIIYVSEPTDDLRNSYASMFTGIVVPPTQLIT